MGKELNFGKLNALFESGKEFELSDVEYCKQVGKPLPKGKSYLINKSPLAREARKHGYSLQINEAAVIQRIVIFKKIQGKR